MELGLGSLAARCGVRPGLGHLGASSPPGSGPAHAAASDFSRAEKSVELVPAVDEDMEGFEIMHLTRVALGEKPAAGPHTVFITCNEGKISRDQGFGGVVVGDGLVSLMRGAWARTGAARCMPPGDAPASVHPPF